MAQPQPKPDPKETKASQTPEKKPEQPEDRPRPKREMGEQDIRDAGMVIDVPHEVAGIGQTEIGYADLGEEKKWVPPKGWPPEEPGDAGTGSGS